MRLWYNTPIKSYLSIIKLVWPLALGMVNNAVMQFFDRAFLSSCSLEALEAVLPAGMLMWIFAGFFQSVIGYSSVFVGQFHGAGDAAKCVASYRAALVIAVLSGIASVPLLPVGGWLLSLSAPSLEVLGLERTYYWITMSGAIFIYGHIAASSYFTGRSKTRIVFWVNLAGNVLNIVLDALFIFALELGMAGAAIATVVAMGAQFAALAVMAERDVLIEAQSSVRVPLRELFAIGGRMLRFGVPSGFYTMLNMVSFTIFVFVTSGVGGLELAVSNACFAVNYLIFAPMEGFSIGASTLVAQAKGRGDPEAAARDAVRVLILGVGFTIAMSALALAFHRPILSIFAAKAGAASGDFHALGAVLFMLMAAWQIFDAADVILSGALKGAGDTTFVLWWMLANSFGLWMPLVWAVSKWYNTMPALWGSMIVYVIIICVGTAIRWCRGGWKKIRLV